MFPSSQSDMHKFCCERSSCSKRRKENENSSQQTSSIEEIDQKPEFTWNKYNQETQMSPSVTTTTSSEKNTITTTSEYNRKVFDFNMEIVHERMVNSRIFKKQLKQLKTLSQCLENCFQENPKDNLPNSATKIGCHPDDSEIIHIEIPLEIHLKVNSKFSKDHVEANVKPNLQQTLPYSITSYYTQTSALSLIEEGYRCSLNKSKDYDKAYDNENQEQVFEQKAMTLSEDEALPTVSEQTFKKLTSKSQICDCDREKLTEEKLQELMKKPNSRLVSLICENKLKCVCDLQKSKTFNELPKKYYRLAYPQHKDLDVCIKCRYDPSPLIDENNRVFCPGKCGCCLCPWKPPASASLENVLLHSKIKICKCRNRSTLFESMEKFDSACSQVSYFDICPCREKAEAKFLALYGKEMWNEDRILNSVEENKEVLLEDVKELYDKERKLKINSQNLLFKDD